LGVKVYTYSLRRKPPGRGNYFQNQQSWDVVHFIRALKREAVNHSAQIPMPTGQPLRYLDGSNQDDAFVIFAEMVAPDPKTPPPQITFVPIPGSKAICEKDVRAGSTYLMALALAERMGAEVEPCLWWREPMPSAHHEGGPRDAATLVEKLELGWAPKKKIVLVDDVLTYGGHIQAAECLIRRNGAAVLLGICAAKTVWAEEKDMFKRSVHDLEEFDDDEP
jgi:hypothetical protein